MRINSLFSIILVFGLAIFNDMAIAESSAKDPLNEVLILIGYADENTDSLSALGIHNFHYNLGFNSQLEISEQLHRKGFKSENPFRYVNLEHKVAVTLINVNLPCPGEASNRVNQRKHVCKEQLELSLAIKKYVSDQTSCKIDQLIYLGHSRLGKGLGLGPFLDDYTLDLRFYNSVDACRLKKVVLASCNAEKYYAGKFKSSGIEFIGPPKEEKDWSTSLLNLVLQQVDTLF